MQLRKRQRFPHFSHVRRFQMLFKSSTPQNWCWLSDIAWSHSINWRGEKSKSSLFRAEPEYTCKLPGYSESSAQIQHVEHNAFIVRQYGTLCLLIYNVPVWHHLRKDCSAFECDVVPDAPLQCAPISLSWWRYINIPNYLTLMQIEQMGTYW